MSDTHTQPHFFQCICQGAKTPNHQNKLSCTLQCTEQQGRHFLRATERRFVKGSYHSEVEGLEPSASHVAFISLTPPGLWLWWPQWELSQCVLLASSPPPLPPPPHPEDRDPGTSACIPAWPGTGLYSLIP